MTPQRLAIVRETMATTGYIVPAEVIARVQAQMAGMSAATVERDQGFRAELTHHAISGLCSDCQTAGDVASG